MSLPDSFNRAPTLAIFCKVVDNYGDIGICWRLARQLWREHGVRVHLWVDDLRSFRHICPEVDPNAAAQEVEGVQVIHWRDQEGSFLPDEVADIVIEFFAVDIPPGYVAAMAQRSPRPVWFNLEGLTAEEWVEGCHRLPSMHPRLKLTKHFFFPGFTAKTGGLIHEAGLEEARAAFQSDPAAMAGFLARFGVTAPEMDALKVSLFCYPHAPVAELLRAWSEGTRPVTCLVPEGVASEAVQAFIGAAATAGSSATRGALTLRVLPFVPQPDYDRLLWACDLNFVRGEDSFVRAQWAGRPFVWHIYPQDENLHHKKLRAFLGRYAGGDALEHFSLGWNGAQPIPSMPAAWQELHTALPQLAVRAEEWREEVLAHGDLATNLLDFARALRLASENPV
ncbi:elongation factor P maturation arginine rhamnosyltransferase EarP [Massilia sp. IC2-476]|uniref:elongation factor P maturation arginine rhamnosyltransferase EarP n=1 Tax=Massilia sp. IC2-476 TaxID=2887199 RepID=UPI001D103633|nr:elongation factor P maturation arginine rhamnosyltransferase EarP [Massilia sp. IC2-476]MCC2973526.1 elongation factor P maturation arginine rhamnosyltransferase EarP [Massilia sp. IC2-476]